MNERDDSHHRPMTSDEEALLDFIVGDLKDHFSVTDHADGSRTVSLDVGKEEVPVMFNLLVNAASTATADMHE